MFPRHIVLTSSTELFEEEPLRWRQARRHEGILGLCPPNHCLCTPSQKCTPPSEDCALQVRCHCLCPPKILLVLPKSKKHLVPGQKIQVKARTNLNILRQRLFSSWLSPLNLWTNTEIRTIRFRRAPPGLECAPPSKN